MSDFKINDKGFWESTDSSGHLNDRNLRNNILNLLKENSIESLVDFGCGMGDYSRYFIENGIICEAYDGNPNTVSLTRGIGKVLDLSEEFNLQKKFECVLSLEVGEHIPKEFEQIFIDNITKHVSKILILSWAVVGQGGDGHVNCQNNDYVIDQITKRGFSFDLPKTITLRSNSTLPWFRDTILVFNKK
jgi:hypothetical protein